MRYFIKQILQLLRECNFQTMMKAENKGWKIKRELLPSKKVKERSRCDQLFSDWMLMFALGSLWRFTKCTKGYQQLSLCLIYSNQNACLNNWEVLLIYLLIYFNGNLWTPPTTTQTMPFLTLSLWDNCFLITYFL